MSLDSLTISELKTLKCLFDGNTSVSNSAHPYKIGTAYLIRGVTHYYTGRLVSVTEQELVLEDAAWIADTGRYNEALETGKLNEVEPIIGPAIIGRGALVDAVEWPSNIPLPREVK